MSHPAPLARTDTNQQINPIDQIPIDRPLIDPDRLQIIHHQRQSTPDRFLNSCTEQNVISHKLTFEPPARCVMKSRLQVPAFTIFTAGFLQLTHACKPVIRVPSPPDPVALISRGLRKFPALAHKIPNDEFSSQVLAFTISRSKIFFRPEFPVQIIRSHRNPRKYLQ